MEIFAWHVTMRLADDWLIVRDTAERRVAAEVLLRRGAEAGLFAFDIPDTHAHAGLLCDRPAAGRFAWSVEAALRHRLGLPVAFGRARIRPIKGQRHLANTFAYILGNTPRHGVRVDPYRECSNLPDLLGLRLLGRYTVSNVRRVLPRTSRSDLLVHLGLSELAPGTDQRRLADAAASATALVDLSGRCARSVAAKRAAVRVGLDLGVTTRQLAELLELHVRQIQRLAGQSVDTALVEAVRLQIGLRERLGYETSA